MSARYALFYAPAVDTPLWRFGCRVLGYDAATGKAIDPLFLQVNHRPWAELTQKAAIYGFHATLKPPFRLAEDVSEMQLIEAVQDFVKTQQSFKLAALQLSRFGGFIALRSTAGDEAGISRLAEDCIRQFDRFRAPLSVDEMARRLRIPLTSRQQDYLAQWGYPYVFEDFQFHLTLSDELDEATADAMQILLQILYRSIAAPVPIGAIALFHQATAGQPMRLMQQFAFG